MRKLRKYTRPVSPPHEDTNSHTPSEPEAELDSSVSVIVAPKGNLVGKSKYSLRQQLVEQYEKRGGSGKNEASQQSASAGEAEEKQHNFDEYLNKLSDDDGVDFDYKSKKPKKKEIKPKNKFFSGLDL